MRWGLAVTAVSVAALLGMLAAKWPTPQRAADAAAGHVDPPVAAQGLPWQGQVQADGSARVMGLHLGVDTLAEVRARVGDGLQVALVARLGEVGALEAFADPFHAGFISGRLVLAFDVPPDKLARWRDAASGSAPMEGGARRFTLRGDDLAAAERAPLAGMSFVPLLRLTEADIRQRFGAPGARRALDDGATLLVYPALGASATVAEGRRGVIQYVAPRDAARLGAFDAPTTPASAASAAR